MEAKKNEDLDQYMRIQVAEDEPDVGYRPLSTKNAYFFCLGDTEALTKFTAEDTAYAEEHCSEGVRWYNTHQAGAHNIELGLDLDAQMWRETLYRTDAQAIKTCTLWTVQKPSVTIGRIV